MLWEMAIERKKRRKWSLPAGVDGEMGDMREREREVKMDDFSCVRKLKISHVTSQLSTKSALHSNVSCSDFTFQEFFLHLPLFFKHFN